MDADFSYDSTISPRDQMWESGQQWYFQVGISALECIRRALATACVTPHSILDMPSGHGRVCRMLRAAYPDAHLTVCDLDPDGVDFCAATFGAEGTYSREDVRDLQLPRAFDLIWCGSLFTHLESLRWADFLDFFERHLTLDGVLVFTTHGRQPIQWMNEDVYSYGLQRSEQLALIDHYDRTGFGFIVPANQRFGLSLSSLAFVCTQVERNGSLRLIHAQEAGWAGHQDVFACTHLRRPYRS
jgi:cyclopropane fatty-acyl-phospholipid synthase-like methyltransferase